MGDKDSIRDEMRRRRRTLDPDWVREASRRIVERAAALEAVRGARAVACYAAAPGEVDLEELMRRCREVGQRVCVPARRDGAAGYGFAWVGVDDCWREGAFGIREPAEPRWASMEAIDIALVPGLAFDGDGNRIGHGKGYYDRLLGGRAGRRPAILGVAFEFQVLKRVPAGPGDVRMDAILTEQKTRNMTARAGGSSR